MRRPPLVSVTVPTYARPDYHEHLYKTFAAQTYPFKELLVFDDSPTPSTFLANTGDARVRYFWTPRRLSIGAKRNALIEAARGSLIAHQDDDDVYRPGYLATMVSRLGPQDLLTKLSVWDARSAYDGSLWRWDTRFAGPVQYAVSGNTAPLRLPQTETAPESLDGQLWGYGFSYLFTREAGRAVPFGDINLGEDLDFVARLRAMAPDYVTHQPDLPDTVIHTVHARSTSRIYPQQCIGWCTPVGLAPAPPPEQTSAGSTSVPKKISLVPGRIYEAVALVKASHTPAELTRKAATYGISVVGLTDDVPPPPGLPAPKFGYRYMRVRARAGKAKSVRSAVPWPFTAYDESRVVALQ